MEDLEVQNIEYENVETFLEDKDSQIFDPVLLNDNVEITQKKLKILKGQGNDTHGVFSLYLFYFFVEQTPNCPGFIELCASKYSPSEGVIMDAYRYKILFLVNSLFILNTLLIPVDFVQMSKEYKEENLVQFFRESSVEEKYFFLKSCPKPDSQFLNHPYPIDYNLFNEENQSLITLASQFLGLDTNKYITEPLLSLMFTLSTGQVESKQLSQSM